jgi:hypothetical protein
MLRMSLKTPEPSYYFVITAASMGSNHNPKNTLTLTWSSMRRQEKSTKQPSQNMRWV